MAVFVVLYLVFGILAGPEILQRDLEDKYGKVLGAVTVSVLVRGMPVKPVVTAVSGCNNSYPYVDLDWGDDLGVDTFDVYRNGDILVSGLTTSNWRDNNVEIATSYTYYVVARGPLGEKQSDEISVSTKTECYIPPSPPPSPPPPPPPPASLTITRLDDIDLTNFRCLAKTNKRYPIFQGITNLAGARIAVEIQSRRNVRKVISSFWANSNGYWAWKSKGKLKKGTKIAYFTAYDPNDANRWAAASLRFQVTKKKPSKKFLKKCRVSGLLAAQFGKTASLHLPLLPSLEIKNEQKVIHPGETLAFSLPSSKTTLFPSATSSAQIGILDREGNLIFEKNATGEDKIILDEKMPPGEYRLFEKFSRGGVDMSFEDDFKVKEKPLIVLGPKYEITSRQILSNLSWAALATFGLLGIFLLLLLFEYHLSQKALIQITGRDLKKRGMID